MGSSSTKKRKSSPSKPSISTKKSKTTTTPITVQVSQENPKYDPVVVSFPRGLPSSLCTENSSSSTYDKAPKFTCSKLNPKSKSSRGRRINGEDANCTYTASATGSSHDNRRTKSYVCIYNKKEKTLKLVPSAEKGTIFSLEQAVKEYTTSVVNGCHTEQTRTATDQVNMLVESFGSKKKQKVMASRAANKVNIHSVVGSGSLMMNTVTKQEGISAENKKKMVEVGGNMTANANEVAYENARKKILPPFDANATKASKVYDAQQFFGEVAWDKASRVVNAVLGQIEEGKISDLCTGLLGKKAHHYPSIATLLKSIDPTKKSSAFRLKAAFLLIMTVKFQYRLCRRWTVDGTSDDFLTKTQVVHEVGVQLFDLFTTPKEGNDGGFITTQQKKQKLYIYILILFVIASGTDMKTPSINQLCKDMKLDVKDASSYLREAGFIVKKNGVGDSSATLLVPLKFPPPKRGKRT